MEIKEIVVTVGPRSDKSHSGDCETRVFRVVIRVLVGEQNGHFRVPQGHGGAFCSMVPLQGIRGSALSTEDLDRESC